MSTSFRPFPTLVAALEDAAQADGALGFRFVPDEGVPGFTAGACDRFLSYPTIAAESARFAGALQELGLQKGDRVALILPKNDDFVLCFLGALRAGLVPVPIYPPVGLHRLQLYLDNTRHIVAKSGARALVSTTQIRRMLGTVQAACEPLEHMVAIETLRAASPRFAPVAVAPDDVAFIQFTSGSTSRPKGVALTHANLMANIRAIMHDGLRMTAADTGVSWLPLYHDMGLIGFMLAPLVCRTPIAFLSPLTFLVRPVTWLQAITRYRGTVCYAPNFAYGLCVKRIRDEELAGIDLSSWRVAGCGAEPIRAETLHGFAQTFAKVGFSAHALLPSYGLAESSLAVAFSELGGGVQTLSVEAEPLWRDAVARVVADDHPGATRLVSCGRAFPGHALAIFDREDVNSAQPLGEGRVGEIRVSGPSIMRGYWDDAERTAADLPGGWLATGDMGFVIDGRLYVCGRSKEIIIINGRNYYPHDVEWAVSRVPDVRKGNVVAFGSRDPADPDRERLVVAFECRHEVPADAEPLVRAVRQAVQEALGIGVDDVVPLSPGVLPKTSSGKLQRTKTRESYEAGTLGRSSGGGALDLVKEGVRSQLSYLRLSILGR